MNCPMAGLCWPARQVSIMNCCHCSFRVLRIILRHMDDTNKTPDNAILKCAAAIAGWHSKQRANGMVKVDMTLAKYVSKPPHSPEGTVSITHVKAMKVVPGLPRPLET